MKTGNPSIFTKRMSLLQIRSSLLVNLKISRKKAVTRGIVRMPQQKVCDDYSKVGADFSMKAVMPIFWFGCANCSPNNLASKAKASARGNSIP